MLHYLNTVQNKELKRDFLKMNTSYKMLPSRTFVHIPLIRTFCKIITQPYLENKGLSY